MQAPVFHSNVSLLKTRPTVYKLGLITLIISFLVFIIGFSSPYWIRFKNMDDYERRKKFRLLPRYEDHQHAGLWDAPCFYSSASCHTAILVAQIAFSFHLVGYVICMAVVVYENCKKVSPVSYRSKVLELCVFVTGITGSAGMAVFVAWYSASLSDRSFNWSLILTSLSLVGIYCSMGLFMVGNRFISTPGTVLLQPQQQTGVVFFKPGNSSNVSVLSNYEPSHAEIHLQQSPQSQPLLPVQPYFHPPGSHYRSDPPPYAFPPAYPLAPQPHPAFPHVTSHEVQPTVHVQPSAPPCDDTQPLRWEHPYSVQN